MGVLRSDCLAIILVLVLSYAAQGTAQSSFITQLSDDKTNLPTARMIVNDIMQKDSTPAAVIDVQPLFHIDQGDTELKRSLGMQKFFTVTIADERSIPHVMDILRKDSRIAEIEPISKGEVPAVPNDPEFSWQWHHSMLNSSAAWDIMKGSRQTVIAILDTGTEFNHEDLVSNIWQNRGEDTNHNGALVYDGHEWVMDPHDLNGIDDDHNGYIDDLIGWDFNDKDNTVIAACGDYQDHGTETAGAAAATTNNALGISGVCWNCTIMPIRAWSMEKDWSLAPAIEYAVDNGADVISMSAIANDTDSLRKAINYADKKGRVLIAAAGNDNLPERKYPAAYPDVISVGATDSFDQRIDGGLWGSNYGGWVDVVAPGASIVTTFIDQTYGYGAGTSLSTPIVSGIAGLIISHHPEFTSRQVRSVIQSAVDPFNSTTYAGTGRIDSFKAMTYNHPGIAEIDMAFRDKKVDNTVDAIPIPGSALSDRFQSYSIEIGRGPYPSHWVTLVRGMTKPVDHAILAVIPRMTLPEDGIWIVRLNVTNRWGESVIDMASFEEKNGQN